MSLIFFDGKLNFFLMTFIFFLIADSWKIPSCQGFASGLREGRGVDELHPLPDTSPEENFMRFTGFGIVNSHSVAQSPW